MRWTTACSLPSMVARLWANPLACLGSSTVALAETLTDRDQFGDDWLLEVGVDFLTVSRITSLVRLRNSTRYSAICSLRCWRSFWSRSLPSSITSVTRFLASSPNRLPSVSADFAISWAN